LLEREVRSLSFKGRIIQAEEVSLYSMPELVEREPLGAGEKEINHSIEEIEREAYERGFEAGEKAGLAMGEEKARVILEGIESLLKELMTLKQRLLSEMRPQIIELATAMARKIILQELKTEPEIIMNMTQEAISRIERTGPITIKINPSLHKIFLRLRPELTNLYEDVIFDLDPSIPIHSTLVIGPEEEVSTDIDEQLRNLIKEMGERIGNLQP
jgi:flagellar assembly protein FliH